VVGQVLAGWGWLGDLQEVGREHAREIVHVSGAQDVISFDQRVQGVRVEYAAVRAIFQTGRGLIAVTGRVFSNVRPTNRVRLNQPQAVGVGRSHVARYTKVLGDGAAKPELVVLPYANTMKFAWVVEVAAEEGTYRMWIDAETRDILRLEPLFSPAAGNRG
jgi:hypothetical protein